MLPRLRQLRAAQIAHVGGPWKCQVLRFGFYRLKTLLFNGDCVFSATRLPSLLISRMPRRSDLNRFEDHGQICRMIQPMAVPKTSL